VFADNSSSYSVSNELRVFSGRRLKDNHEICESEHLIAATSFPVLLKETFEKWSVLPKFKAGENLNRRNTWSILRIKI
jgi:hypothetical protein